MNFYTYFFQKVLEFFKFVYILLCTKVVHKEFGFCTELKKGVSYNTGRHTF